MNYNTLINKPKINNITLEGNLNSSDLNIVDLDDFTTTTNNLQNQINLIKSDVTAIQLEIENIEISLSQI